MRHLILYTMLLLGGNAGSVVASEWPGDHCLLDPISRADGMACTDLFAQALLDHPPLPEQEKEAGFVASNTPAAFQTYSRVVIAAYCAQESQARIIMQDQAIRVANRHFPDFHAATVFHILRVPACRDLGDMACVKESVSYVVRAREYGWPNKMDAIYLPTNVQHSCIGDLFDRAMTWRSADVQQEIEE